MTGSKDAATLTPLTSALTKALETSASNARSSPSLCFGFQLGVVLEQFQVLFKRVAIAVDIYKYRSIAIMH